MRLIGCGTSQDYRDKDMKEFKFLKNKYNFNGIVISEEIKGVIYELCHEYTEFIDKCREDHLRQNPSTNPDLPFSFNIPYKNIHRFVDEGNLWHADTDYDEDEDIITHYVFLDNPTQDYYFYVEENDDREYDIVEAGTDNSRDE